MCLDKLNKIIFYRLLKMHLKKRVYYKVKDNAKWNREVIYEVFLRKANENRDKIVKEVNFTRVEKQSENKYSVKSN